MAAAINPPAESDLGAIRKVLDLAGNATCEADQFLQSDSSDVGLSQ
jgi:hypothetical protein